MSDFGCRGAFTLAAQQPPQRFGPGLDFFAAMKGDDAAFERGMSTTEKMIAENPRNAEALVWHGIGATVLAEREFKSATRKRAGSCSRRA